MQGNETIFWIVYTVVFFAIFGFAIYAVFKINQSSSQIDKLLDRYESDPHI